MSDVEGPNRREWMFRVLQTAVALGTAGGAVNAQEHAARHSHPVTASPWVPQVLTPEQNNALVAIGERIIPGSSDAFCNRFIDLILTLESDAKRRQFLDALSAINGEARHRHQKPFSALTANEQSVLLEAAEANPDLKPQFQVIKEWMADSYWSSEKGLRELGWDGRMAWAIYPDCDHHRVG
jgi:hypothetical protein